MEVVKISIIKEKRIELGLTQEEMAQKLGYKSKSGYCMLENGKVKLKAETAVKISNILGIGIEKIFRYYVQES